MNTFRRIVVVALAVLAVASIANAAAFTPGNIVAYRVGDGVAALGANGTAVFLDEYTPAGTFVQTVAMPNTGASGRLVAAGNATTEGFLTLSSDGHYLIVPGYDALVAAVTPATSTTIPRVIGRVDSTGALDATTSYVDASSAGNLRSATSVDGSRFWTSGSTQGARTLLLGNTSATIVSSTATNMRNIAVFAGQLYIGSGAGTVRMATVGSGLPTGTGNTMTNLPGLPTATATINGFFFADLDAGVAGVDTLYLCDETAGQVQKWSLAAGTWTQKGSVTVATARGLAGTVSGSNVTLFATSGGAGTPIVTFTDTSGYNATLSGSATTIVATAGTNKAFRGVAMVPTAVAPVVNSIVRASANPTNAASVNYTVTFSQSVTGVDATDFTLTTTGVSGASVSGVSGSGTTYTVTVNTGSGSGTIRLDVTDNDSIVSGAVPLGGVGAGNGNFTTGEVYTIDKTGPTVLSIVRNSTNPTNASLVDYIVTFSESVTGVDSADFGFTATVGSPSVNAVTGSGATRTVTVNTGTGSGTLRLDLIDNTTITDTLGNALTGGNFLTGEVYTIDKAGPTVVSSVRVNADPTALSNVDFTVTFSESVTGVDVSDFSLTTTGLTGTSVTNVTGSGTTYTVTANTGSGASGTLRLDVNNGASIQDGVGNALASGFTGGQTYTIDRNAPAVVSVTRNNANPTNAASVGYTVTFNQSVTGVDSTDFTLTTTGVTGTSITGVTGSGTTYTVTVNTGSGDGTIRLDVLNDGSIQSGTSVPLSAPFSSGEVYTVDRTAPTVSSIVRANSDPNRNASVNFTVNFSEAVSGVANSDFTLTTTGVTGASVTGVTGSGASRTVTVNTGTGDGTIRLNLVTGGAIIDAAGNPLTTGFTTGETYTIDKTPPTVVSIVRADANPSSAASVNFTVTFSEAVTGTSNADFVLTTTGVTGASVTGVTGSGSTRTVTVNTGSGDGTIRLDQVTGGTLIDLAGNLITTTFNSGQVYTIDKLPPTVVSINRAGTSPTGAASIGWTVTFSEPVTGVDSGDFALAATGVAGASISGVTGSGTTYTVTANSGTGDGTLGLNLSDNDSIIDVDGGRPLGGPGAGNGNFTGQVYTIDHTAPTVVSINRASTDPTTAASVNFTVTFDSSVTGVNSADFALAASGLSGAAITNVTGSGTTYTVTTSTGTGNGTLGLNLADDDSIIDVAGNPLGGPGAGNGNFTGQVYTVNRAAASHLVISQVYGGGGNGGSIYKNDFIELFNPTGATVSVNGWSVQYSSSAGSTWQVTNLSGSVAPGHYYLVQESAGAGGTTSLPTPDASAGILMAAGAGKVALVNQTTALTGTCPLGVTVIDFVGYGGANCSEGGTPTAVLTNTTSASRIDNGCTDTDHNNTDFTAGTVNPRNSASSPWSCGGLIGAGSASPSTVGASANTLLTVSVSPAQSPTSTGITVTGDLTPIGGSASQTFFDNGTNGDVTPGDNIFSFTATVGAATSSGSKIINLALADAQTRTGAATISLTVLGATNPTGNGTATPASVAPTQTSLLTVAVTGGQNPPSTGITVTADLSAIGGSASQTLFDNGTNGDAAPGDLTFSYNATVANGTTLGLKSLPFTVLDSQARSSSSTISLTIQSATAPPAPTNLVAVGGNAQVSLSWDASAGATGYNVKRGTAPGGPYATVASNVPTNSFLDTLVANGTHYYYIVTATNATDESGPSNEANAIPQAPPPAAGAKIYFIDIGQGASTLIVSPTGKTLLVDGGPTGQGTAKVVPLLNTLGISRVDYSILTHYHIDHDDGLTETNNATPTRGPLVAAYDNGDTAPLQPPNAGSTKTAYQNYVNSLTSHSITRIRPEDVGGTLAGQVIDLGGGMKATIIAQGGKLLSGGSVAIDNSDLNTESISTLIEYNNFDFLVSGDLTGGGSTSTAKTPDVETFAAQLAGDIDIVEYDHHGSTTANNPKFLRILKAEAAVAECGYTNTFGHPNRETVNKFLNIPASSGNTYGGTALPNPGNGPVSYQTDPSPATDDRVSRQGYSGAAPADAGNGTILLKTDGLTSFTMESFEDGGVRLNPAAHAYSLDSAGAGVTTNFPPTVIPAINPLVPLATDTVTVQAMVNDREDPITSVTLNYALNGAAQAPVTMNLNAGFYEATIAPQPNATRVDYTVTAVAGGKATSYSTGYFSGTTPIATLRVLDSLGEPLYLDYAARIAGTATSDTNIFSIGTNDDYIQDATGGINIWRTIQPSVPAVDSIATGHTYTVAGRIGELAGRFHLEVTPPFASVAPTPYTVTDTGSGTVTPAVKTIAQIIANPESLEGQLVSIANCTITSGTIPGSGASADAFITVTDGTGSFQLKIDKDTSIPGMTTPAGAFAIVGIIQQDDFLRPFDSGYDIAPRSRVDLGGVNAGGPPLITIAAARIDVDGSGNSPGDYVPDLLNSTVHIQGAVTSINFRQSNGSGIEYYVQDPTGGVDVFSTATTRSLNIGDDVDVIATVKQFNGLTEIDPGATTSNLTVLAPGSLPAISPRLVTAADLGDNGVGEPLEGQLLRINNVTLTAPPATWVASTNYTITDSSGSATIRISASANLVGQAPPAGTFSIIGVLGQFDSAAPFDSGYQLFPRSTSDILPAVPATAAIQATAGTPQSATINTAFATQLQATVRDAGNAVISGAGITFSAPASGASGTFPGGVTSVTVVSDAGGVGTAPVFTANSTAGPYSVTATSGPVNTTFSLTNLAQSATHFSVSAPASVTNGVAFSVTVSALNASNAIVPGYTGTVHFSSTSNGTLPADYAFTGGDAGTHTFSFTLTSNGSQSIDAGDGPITGTANLTVIQPPATHFSVTAPVSVTAGSAFSVTVSALDASNAATSNYTGTVHFTSSSAGTLPADYTFTVGDAGVHVFSVTLTAAGSQSVTATDTVTGSINGTANTTVVASAATHYSVSAPASVTAGSAFSVTVTALDASNNTATGYTGIAHFTSSSAGTLPANYTFTGGDAGVHIFSVTLTTPGSQSITATDTVTASITGTTNTTVNVGAATHYSVSAPASVTAGSAFSVTVTALDAANNTVTGYTGIAHFTSSSAGTLPANYTFTGGDAGVHVFSVTLTTPGSQSITATDTVTASITGTTNTTVNVGAATHYSVSAPASVTAGSAFSVTVTALDVANNTVTGYTGIAHFTSSSAGTLPADYTFTGGDAGVHIFSVTLTTPGSQSITATDTVTASITGTTNTTVNAGAATHFSINAPANVSFGAAFSVTVTALDSSNNTAIGYTGTAHFTSSATGTLPADYTFTGGDAGVHLFSVTLTTAGTQSITATDTVTASITGTTNTNVSTAPATHFSVSAPASVTNGTPFSVTVTALDASNATVAGYTGTVHFTSSSAGTLPANYTFVGGDNGAHIFSVTLTTNGAQSITATDTVTASITGSANTTVNPPPATHFSVSAPASVTNGTAFSVTVTALDASNATVPGYTGTVHFTSSSTGTLPANYTFTGGDAGVHAFSVTLTSNGPQSITATDTVTASITGTANTTVNCPSLSVNASNNGPACAPATVTLSANSPNAGVSYSWTGPGGFTSNQQNPTGINLSGTYIVTITFNGCTATSSTNVTVTSAASSAITAPSSLCANNSYNASAPAGASTYNWSITNGTITGGAGTNAITFTAGASGSTTLNLTVSNGSCNSSSSTSMPIHAAPSVSIPLELSICGPGTVTIPMTLTGVAPWTITWSDGFVQSGVTSSHTSRGVAITTNRVISITSVSDASCTANFTTKHITLKIDSPIVIVTPPVDQHVGNPNQQATFTVVATGDNLHYHWYYGNVGDTSNEVGPDAPTFTTWTIHGFEHFWLRITNACGSVDSAQLIATNTPPRRRSSGQ